MKLGLQLGGWGAQPPTNTTDLVAAAEHAGYDAVFTAETWGSDAFTPLAWLGAATDCIRLGTSVAQLSARTPTACAMAALTLDHLSGGRHILGLGGSGAGAVEGWYGQPSTEPLAQTREYVDILRQVWAREEPVTSAGPHFALPLNGSGTTGHGRAVKSIVHPLRNDIPVFLDAQGPDGVALTAEIADGWLPPCYAPRLADTYNEWLDDGFSRVGARRRRDDFEICAATQLIITADRTRAIEQAKPSLVRHIVGIGLQDSLFRTDLLERLGYASVVEEVAALVGSGHADRAADAIPTELVDEFVIIGDIEYVRDRITTWETAGVTTLVLEHRTLASINECAAVIGAQPEHRPTDPSCHQTDAV